ncbi:arylsulfatase [Pseudozobellia thermophila]|uniref:Arylsulfatase A n=1 Tax=Pseudozobellia thermophila TaxID=192903 RepID=A0A1M6FXK9_9FLAO|nr:arylsulfatase [Pseudozobellia thermophila]SHJ02453.1 Arylsulfatase A [Pseudozobellia thermophila]
MPTKAITQVLFNTSRTRAVFLMLLPIIFSCKEDKQPQASSGPREGKNPNIVLILADDQGWGDLSSSGNANLSTPNIDALALNGASFENFYVQPVCSPTRAELLTGRHFPRTGVYSTSSGGERMDYNETTLAEILKGSGYRTAAYGKWHNGMQAPYHPNSQGFDDFYGFASGHWGNYFSPMLEHNGEIVKGNGFLADDLTDHGLDFIEKSKSEPFFLYLPLNTPHSPMQVPEAYWNRFKNKELRKFSDDGNKEDPDFTRAALAMVENIDYNVGRIIERLRKLHLEDQTIVVYLSDNGPNSFRWNGGMRGKKGSTDEGGVRSPLYIQWTNVIRPGTKIETTASAIDLLPTLTHMAELQPRTNKPIDGKDLSPLLFDTDKAWPDRIIYNHWNGKTSLRTQNYRLDNGNRLYDMQKDRSQKNDISSQFPKLVDSLVKAKKEWLDAVDPLTRDTDDRFFTLGHPDYTFTQLPARDAMGHGNIKRSNKYPNDSFLTNWKSVQDSITWHVEVLADGRFEVDLFYTCPEESVGSIVELSLGSSKIAQKISEAHDPPLSGQENDRVPRMESYVKDFKPMGLGTMTLRKGRGTLTLKTTKVADGEVADVRMLYFKRID